MNSRNCSPISVVALILVILSSIGCSNPKQEATNQQKPNILFIMSDDHTTQAIGAYGSRLAKLNPTPTIDRLAKEGVLFENAFCTNAICTPSRATIMTGQYSQEILKLRFIPILDQRFSWFF